jgi:predicted ATP-binding protein involved in virulence
VANIANSAYFTTDHSPLVIDTDNTFSLTMSTSAQGKMPQAPLMANTGNTNGVNRNTGLISVEPPKQSDLQVGSLCRWSSNGSLRSRIKCLKILQIWDGMGK